MVPLTPVTDRRILRSKSAVRSALAQLVSVKSIDRITVQELCLLAGVSRKTFYNYYTTIFDVVEEIESTLVHRIDAALSEADFLSDLQDPSRILNNITRVIDEDREFYRGLLRMSRASSVYQRLVALIKERMIVSALDQTRLSRERANILLDFLIPGVLSVYQNWLNGEQTVPLSEISRQVSSLAIHGVTAFVQGE